MNARDNYVSDDQNKEQVEGENKTEETDIKLEEPKQKSIFEKFTEKLKAFLENAE